MTGNYHYEVYLTGVDKDKAREVRFALSEVMKGVGKVPLRKLMKRAHDGEKILIHQSNLEGDATAVAQKLRNSGADVEVDGLLPPEKEF